MIQSDENGNIIKGNYTDPDGQKLNRANYVKLPIAFVMACIIFYHIGPYLKQWWIDFNVDKNILREYSGSLVEASRRLSEFKENIRYFQEGIAPYFEDYNDYINLAVEYDLNEVYLSGDNWKNNFGECTKRQERNREIKEEVTNFCQFIYNCNYYGLKTSTEFMNNYVKKYLKGQKYTPYENLIESIKNIKALQLKHRITERTLKRRKFSVPANIKDIKDMVCNDQMLGKQLELKTHFVIPDITLVEFENLPEACQRLDGVQRIGSAYC